jgi:hypothetical protein
MHTDTKRNTFAQPSLLRRLTLDFMRFLMAQIETSPAIPPLALLIDGDNISPAFTPSILAEASNFGQLVTRRIYGNWSSPNMQRWREVAAHYALEQKHHGLVAPGKNATDIALVIDALDLLYSGNVQHFCLVTSDSDYTPLVLRLRQAGCLVLGICDTQKAPVALVNAFSVVIPTEQFTSQTTGNKTEPMPNNITSLATKQTKAKKTASIAQDSEPTENIQLITLLRQAYKQALLEGKSEWVPASSIGHNLKLIEPTFKASTYGHKGLTALLTSKICKEHFESRILKKGQQLEVRPKTKSGDNQEGLEGSQKQSGSSSQLVL